MSPPKTPPSRTKRDARLVASLAASDPSERGAGAEMAILQAETVDDACAALLAALGPTGLAGVAVAYSEAGGVAFHPKSARTAEGEAAVSMALVATPDTAAAGLHVLHRDVAGASAFLLARDGGVLPGFSPAQQRLLWLGGHRLRELLTLQTLQSSIAGMTRADQLQRALFEIADLAGSDSDMSTMLRGLHDIIGQLMYAENFYIALYDGERQTLRFLYFVDTVDTVDPLGPRPDEEIPIASLERGLTWYLIQDRKPLMGPSHLLRKQVSGPLELHGPDSGDWLGVPMLREGKAVGALVVQSYRDGVVYSDANRAVLGFVADHVLTAVERKQGQEELELRVLQRTRELAEANEGLQVQIIERERAEHLQATLYRIAALTNTEDSAERFYHHIHLAVGELINAENFYIALVSDDGARLEFPYFADTVDSGRETRPMGRGLSEYVIRHGKAVLADSETVDRLIEGGEVTSPSSVLGSRSLCWLGVPLMGSAGVIGLVAVQSYRSDLRYDDRDAELLTFVSYQIASSLQRRKQAEALRLWNAELEQRVDVRTRELREQIDVREQIEAQLQHQVMHDSLTGLPNRLYLRDRLERAIAGFRRTPNRPFALLYLDVDRFKLFNDSLGHPAGDEVLREVVKRLLKCVREPDVVARLSGDEFAILLEHSPFPQTACKVAQRIQSSLLKPMLIAERELQASVSIGVAISEARHKTADELLHDADVALYRAKSTGRQRFVLFDDSLQHTAMNELELEHQLRTALLEREFLPYFQPLVRLTDGAVVGYEALIRWQHPQRGLLAPGEFLKVAEECGLIEAIDWQMYKLACSAGIDLVRDGGYVSLNVSPRHFQNNNFDQLLLQLLAKEGFEPAKLRVEVTEGTLLGDPVAVAAILGRLRDAGIDAALDDFGTGYSSLGYVHRFPLKMIKIDRSFVDPLGGDDSQRSSAIVGAVLSLAHSLGIEAIAEGVETETQRQALIEMGCIYAQGYLFGRPQPASHWLL